MSHALNSHVDYQGNERLPGFVRGVTSVPCGRCGTTGKGTGRNAPWCDDCGGYGDVPATASKTAARDDDTAETLLIGAAILDIV